MTLPNFTEFPDITSALWLPPKQPGSVQTSQNWRNIWQCRGLNNKRMIQNEPTKSQTNKERDLSNKTYELHGHTNGEATDMEYMWTSRRPFTSHADWLQLFGTLLILICSHQNSCQSVFHAHSHQNVWDPKLQTVPNYQLVGGLWKKGAYFMSHDYCLEVQFKLDLDTDLILRTSLFYCIPTDVAW